MCTHACARARRISGAVNRFTPARWAYLEVSKRLVPRDGGLGSILPFYCPYGTQYTRCGPRDRSENGVTSIGDDSCAHARDGECTDGGDGSKFYLDQDGNQRALCRLCKP